MSVCHILSMYLAILCQKQTILCRKLTCLFHLLFFPVDVLVHEPTLARVYTAAEIGVDMMSLCTQLDVLCKKELLQVSCLFH